MKKRKTDRLVLQASLALGATLAVSAQAGVSSPATVDATPATSLLWHTLASASPTVFWHWPDKADRAVLRVTGLNGKVLERTFTDRSVCQFAWSDYAVPTKPEAENLLGFTLSFYAGEDELTDERLSAGGIASVQGRGPNAFSVLPADRTLSAWQRREKPAAVGLLDRPGTLSVDGAETAYAAVPAWFGFPIAAGDVRHLQFTPSEGVPQEIFVRGTGNAFMFIVR